MKLNEVKSGETFKIAGVEFIKFAQDGDRVFAVTKDVLFKSSFGNNAHLAESKIKTRLEKEFLPKLEAEVGAENILEFETDMLALDGTRPYPNFKSKISLITLDFYRQHRDIFETYKLDAWWWLATPDSEACKNIFLCVSPRGDFIYDDCDDDNGVRPVLCFESSIFVSCEG